MMRGVKALSASDPPSDVQRFSAFAWHRAVISAQCALDPFECLVMLALVRFADDTGRAFPGMGTLATVTRVSRTKVVRSLAALEARGLFVRQAQTKGKGRGSNTYWLPPEPPRRALEPSSGSARQTLPSPQATTEADNLMFNLRPATDEERRLQSAVAADDLDMIRRAPRTECVLDLVRAFERGFNPENSSWLNGNNAALTLWALYLACKGQLTHLYFALLAKAPKRTVARVIFEMGMRPDLHPEIECWRSTSARTDALMWFAEWNQERAANVAAREKAQPSHGE